MVDNPTGDDVYYEYGAPGAAYNAAGRVTKETAGKLIDQYRYGALGEVVKKTRTIEGKQYSITWKWDNFGRLRTIVYSNNVVIYYAYDTGGQVKQVFGYYNGTRMDYVNNVYYDKFGSRTTIAYANGVVSQYSYDVLMHRLISLKTTMGDSTYQNITYSYDKVGNIVARSENGIVMSDNTVKNITHHYGYDSLYRLTQAEGSIKENGTTVNSYTSTLQYSSIGTIVQKLQTVKIAGENDPSLTYSYNYSYAPNKPHAVVSINDNLTYRYDANGNMTAVYDTAKQFNRILSWDDDNRLTKTVDTTSGTSVTTQYNYDAKGMRIIKDGPYGKSIYIDTGYVESGAPQTTAPIVSNHIFVGNTRVASVVKHTEEKNPATYFYASDHLGSSSVLTTNTGSYHERIEYLPYGETWVEDKATSDSYTTPYKFTGKELDTETGLYYFGARYYDARVSRWISADPALADGKYFPKPNDYDTEHDFYWYLQQDGSKKLAGLGGVFNAVNMDVYHYAGDNPIRFVDNKGEDVFGTLFEVSLTGAIGFRYQSGYAIDSDLNVYKFSGFNVTNGSMVSIGVNNFYSEVNTADEYFNSNFITLEAGITFIGGEFGIGNNPNNEVVYTRSIGVGKSPKKFKFGLGFNFCTKETSNVTPKKLSDKKEVRKALEILKTAAEAEGNKNALEIINKAIEKYFPTKNKQNE